MTVWVLAADASRARFFKADSRLGPLEEVTDLVHPESRLREQGLVSDSPGQGRGRPVAGGPAHTVGHEDDATRVEEERFAREVANALDEARRQGRFDRLHLLCAPRFLGMLRDSLDEHTRKLVVGERDLDVSAMSAGEIRTHLPDRL
jgi:protein required for attachment to host cells